MLRENDCPAHLIEPIRDCIRIHAFSRGLVPETIEGKVLQDADRLDAIGAIGIARCFATCAEMGVPFYNPDRSVLWCRGSPMISTGASTISIANCFGFPDGLHTATARAIANDRIRIMDAFLHSSGTGDPRRGTAVPMIDH